MNHTATTLFPPCPLPQPLPFHLGYTYANSEAQPLSSLPPTIASYHMDLADPLAVETVIGEFRPKVLVHTAG